jgi:hypothetical protein
MYLTALKAGAVIIMYTWSMCVIGSSNLQNLIRDSVVRDVSFIPIELMGVKVTLYISHQYLGGKSKLVSVSLIPHCPNKSELDVVEFTSTQ